MTPPKLPVHATALDLDAADVTANLADAGCAIFAMEEYRPGTDDFIKAAHARFEEVLYGTADEIVDWLDYTPPAVPAAVKYGCLNRLFTYIEEKVLKSAGYNKAIGLDLGVEASAKPAPDPLAVPEFHLRTGAGRKAEIGWIKGPYDGVRLQFDLGASGILNDTDMRPPYTLNWLPAADTTAIIKVRLMYILKGTDTGNWSEWQFWTLTGT